MTSENCVICVLSSSQKFPELHSSQRTSNSEEIMIMICNYIWWTRNGIETKKENKMLSQILWWIIYRWVRQLLADYWMFEVGFNNSQVKLFVLHFPLRHLQTIKRRTKQIMITALARSVKQHGINVIQWSPNLLQDMFQLMISRHFPPSQRCRILKQLYA